MFDKIVNNNIQITTITVEWEDDFSELLSLLETFFDDHNTDYLLLDLRNGPVDTITEEHIKGICQCVTSRTDDNSEGGRASGKIALVGSTNLQFGIGRMCQAYFEMEDSSINVSVFHTMEEALSWLEDG